MLREIGTQDWLSAALVCAVCFMVGTMAGILLMWYRETRPYHPVTGTGPEPDPTPDPALDFVPDEWVPAPELMAGGTVSEGMAYRRARA